MVPFSHSRTFRDYDALRLFNRARHVGLEFGAFHFVVAMHSIYLTVVVEDDSEVVDAPLHVDVLPRAFDLVADEALKSFTVDIAVEIELSVVMPYAWSPYALAVDFLAVLEREGIVIEIEAVEAVRYVFPVYEILRMQYDKSRHTVHRSAGKVIVFSDPDYIRIGELVIEKRIGVGSVAVVRAPRLSGFSL